jgi:predicted transcriptional regulator
MKLLTETYEKEIAFTLSCFDRLIITGTLPEISYGAGMTSYLYQKGIKIFDYAKYAEPFREQVRVNAERIAKDEGLSIEFIGKSGVRKESIISKKIETRGAHSGIVHIISAMEACDTFKPWHNKTNGKTYLIKDQGKCLHYYFYFIDEQLGLGYVRVPTWCPFRLQVYINGHNLLASELIKAGIKYSLIDNAFDSIEDVEKAQEISDTISIEKLHRKLEEFSWKFCPVYKEFNLRYHWSVMQAEYSTDIVFKKQEDLQQIYAELIATAIHTVKPENIATFLGHKLDGRYQGEMGNNYNVRIQGSRVKHTMGSVSIKMYDKFSKILRIETTANDISFFKHYREVVHRDGTTSYEMARLKKNIYSLSFLADNLKASNKRYLEFISAFNNKEIGRKRLEYLSESKTENDRNYKGFNFFSDLDLSILLAILRGEFNISGFRNKHLQKQLGFNGSKISRLIKRLRIHGLIKKATDSYKYYVTKLGKETIIMAQKIKELVMIPAFSY